LRKNLAFLLVVALSALFTFAFFFFILESMKTVNEFLLNFFPNITTEAGLKQFREIFRFVRLFGYVAFGIVLVLILAGFAARKGYLSSIGSVALYLPVFGYFSLTMFFLVGIGVMRALWFPLIDGSPTLLLSGDIVLAPLWILGDLFFVLDGTSSYLLLYDIGRKLSFVVIGIGVFIFFLGVLTWLHGKFRGYEIVDFWIYRFSRHPQYLGFLLWSYGMLMLTFFLRIVSAWGVLPSPGLPWLVSSLTIIAVALDEELKMIEEHGEKYLKYRGSAPFMLPVPKLLSELITFPVKVLLKKKLPENRKEIAYTALTYGVMLTLLTYVFDTARAVILYFAPPFLILSDLISDFMSCILCLIFFLLFPLLLKRLLRKIVLKDSVNVL